MNWQAFQTHNDAPTHAFEALCNQIFDLWCKREYTGRLSAVTVINGSGGDGGVESYATLNDGAVIGLQAKWFRSSITTGQFSQIYKSFETAVKIRPNINKYIVCIPRDLASIKMGKDCKPVTDTEFIKWQKVKEKILILKPDIEIELWDESHILKELQFDEAVGIYKFWFEKSELSDDTFQYSYDKQKSSWLSQKYFTGPHSSGYIFERIQQFLGCFKFRQDCCNNLMSFKELCDSYLIASLDYLDSFTENEQNQVLQSKIRNYNKQVASVKEKAEKIFDSVENEATSKTDLYRTGLEIDFYDLENAINDFNYHNEAYFHINEIKKLIKRFEECSLNKTLNNLSFSFDNNKVIFLGNPGTGKTHGVGDTVEYLLKHKQHIPILIQAKGIVKDSNWRYMLIKTLAISNDWSEEELWEALEAAAFRREVNTIQDANTKFRIATKIIICIDGIDESKPYEYWIDRLREMDEISKRHPRIKFCVTSRPFVFKDIEYTDTCFKNRIFINDDGDVSVHQLFDSYLSCFEIKLEECSWLKWTIKTPLALRLFCESYRGLTLNSVDPAALTIHHLLQNKIIHMDKEFSELIHSDYGAYQHIIHSSLICIAQCLYEHDYASEDKLCKLLSESKGELGRYPDKVKILNYIENYGLLQSYCERQSSVLDIPEKKYSIGMVPFFDYIIATIFIHSNKNPDDMIVTGSMSTYTSALQMAGIILIEDYKYLICDNPSVKKNVDEETIFDVTCFSLMNSSISSAEKFSGRLLTAMKHFGADGIRVIVNKIILPVSRGHNHPLGPSLLNEFLNSFVSVGKRDLVWSIPTWLPQSKGHVWECYNDLDIFKENSGYELCDEDLFNGLPLLYAWTLSTVEQNKRVFARNELATWSMLCPDEFCKLFCMFTNINDAQIREDLFSIAMGVAFTIPKDSKLLVDLVNWVLEEIFSQKHINRNCNAAIRYYSNAIAERAYFIGVITEEQVLAARPPYQTDELMIPTSKEALAGTRMGGYHLISYDLSRYALCDPINYQFFQSYLKCDEALAAQIEESISCLLKKHAQILEQTKITSDQLIITAAHAYVLLQGWNKHEFYGNPNGGKPGEKIGIDISILRKYHPSSHGSKSNVMTFTEKYIWSARNEIIGYLADRLRFLHDDDTPCFLDDYSLLSDFPNPMQEMSQCDPDLHREHNEWYLPENLSPDIPDATKNRESLQLWIKSAIIPDFEKWITIQDKEFGKKYGMDSDVIALYNYTSITNDSIDAESIMWIAASLIDECNFEQLKFDLTNNKKDILRIFSNPENIYSVTKSQCYITPKEICWMPWKKNICDTYSNCSEDETISCDYAIIKTVEKCTTNNSEFGDIYYKLPSKIIREYLSITDGDGNKYIDNSNITQAFYNVAGEAWGNAQNYLCCNKELLSTNLADEKQRIFWIVRLLREPSSKATEKYANFHSRYDRCWIVWMDGIETKSQLFLDEYEF